MIHRAFLCSVRPRSEHPKGEGKSINLSFGGFDQADNREDEPECRQDRQQHEAD